MERARIQGLTILLGTPYYQETSEATNFKFFTHIHRIDRNKCPLKISGKVAVDILWDS